MDTVGGEELGRFWSEVAGHTFGHGLAMCRVPEPKTVKHRVHLDVYSSSLFAVEALGARVVLPAEESGQRWTVMADPEGGEFCVFLRDPAEVPSYRVHGLVVDSRDPEAIARWWGDALGVTPSGGAEQGWWWLEDVPGSPIATMDFVPVPEPKTAKNRIHWDVYGDAGALVASGATVLREPDEEIRWHVMADPEGNEFCVFEPVV